MDELHRPGAGNVPTIPTRSRAPTWTDVPFGRVIEGSDRAAEDIVGGDASVRSVDAGATGGSTICTLGRARTRTTTEQELPTVPNPILNEKKLEEARAGWAAPQPPSRGGDVWAPPTGPAGGVSDGPVSPWRSGIDDGARFDHRHRRPLRPPPGQRHRRLDDDRRDHPERRRDAVDQLPRHRLVRRHRRLRAPSSRSTSSRSGRRSWARSTPSPRASSSGPSRRPSTRCTTASSCRPPAPRWPSSR